MHIKQKQLFALGSAFALLIGSIVLASGCGTNEAKAPEPAALQATADPSSPKNVPSAKAVEDRDQAMKRQTEYWRAHGQGK